MILFVVAIKENKGKKLRKIMNEFIHYVREHYVLFPYEMFLIFFHYVSVALSPFPFVFPYTIDEIFLWGNEETGK